MVKGEDLARVVSNTMKFVNPKSLYLPGELLFELTESRLTCYSCDDYIALLDSCEALDGSPGLFVLRLEDVKTLEEWARKNKKYQVDIRMKMNDVIFEVDGEEEPEASASFHKARFTEENWGIVDMILNEQDYENESFHLGAISPARLTKISQLKTEKDVPMDIKTISINGHLLLRFKLGHTIIGCIKTLDRSVIDKTLLWE